MLGQWNGTYVPASTSGGASVRSCLVSRFVSSMSVPHHQSASTASYAAEQCAGYTSRLSSTYTAIIRSIWCRFAAHLDVRPASRAIASAGSSSAMSMAITAITTSSSISVNAAPRFRDVPQLPVHPNLVAPSAMLTFDMAPPLPCWLFL